MLSVLEMARQLVSIDSASKRSNLPIADLISQFCEDAGCVVRHIPYSDGKQVNVVATKGGDNPTLVLAGHTDTVGYESQEWATNPLELTRRGEDYYGLGITDMKLALASIITAVSNIREGELERPVGLYFTAQEEIGCVGAKVLVQGLEHVAPYTIVCEPTGMKVANRHKGYIYFKITVCLQGDKHKREGDKRSHSSDDRGMTNVVEVLMPIVFKEIGIIREYLRTITDPVFDPPYTTLNVGLIMQPVGASKNIIPSSFELHCDARPVLSIDQDHLLRLLERRLRAAVNRYHSSIPGEKFVVEVGVERRPTPAMFTGEESLLLSALGERSPISVPYNTEAGLYNGAGSQAVILGPGTIGDAHHRNERVSKRWLQPDVVERYTSVIRNVCGQGGSNDNNKRST